MMRWFGVGTLLIVVAAAFMALAGTTARASQEDPFPHLDHQGLFPLCAGCHEGVPAGERSDWYPEPESCAGCHDGVDRDEVSWGGPSTRLDNVQFDHVEHAAELSAEGDPEQVCADCHIEPDGGRMEVNPDIQVETCWSCHEHQTDDHYDVDAACETCHVPLASSDFGIERIRDLPKPQSHESELFVSEVHGDLVRGRSDRCATCHTQDRCASCHVDADRIEIAALPPAPSSMDLPHTVAEYPEPGSHLDDGWLEEHRPQASVRECSTCHTTNDCRTCHVASVPDLVAALPAREDVVAPGVMLESRSPDTHESMFFMQAHPVLAATDASSCATCHVERFCVACHDAEAGGGYHPSNFMVRHSSEAYGRDTECANCHETAAFCRECHTDLGFAGARVATKGFHDASPVWLLQHGQAARQSVESCASCHRQRDCTRCHSTLGAFKVSPHSSAFDAERAWLMSPRTCSACHIGNPLIGDTP